MLVLYGYFQQPTKNCVRIVRIYWPVRRAFSIEKFLFTKNRFDRKRRKWESERERERERGNLISKLTPIICHRFVTKNKKYLKNRNLREIWFDRFQQIFLTQSRSRSFSLWWHLHLNNRRQTGDATFKPYGALEEITFFVISISAIVMPKK